MKDILRQQMIKLNHEDYSHKIQKNLKVFLSYKNIAAFLPIFKNEPNLLPLFNERNFLLPKWSSKSKIMDFYIHETEEFCKINPKTLVPDVIFVPGLAFSKTGDRLGRGKGCYDATLKHYKSSIFVGVCFEEQILDHIPTEPHDISMDFVCTDNNIY